MIESIRGMISNCGIKDFAFLPFDAVKNDLLDCRAKNRLPKEAKTVIICAFPYKVKEEPPENISRYAAVPDYHYVLKQYLENAAFSLSCAFCDNEFEVFIDNSPIKEVNAAAKAGLGIKGKNGLLITKEYGSFVFLGEIVTDLPLECTEKEITYCENCGKCLERCRVGLNKDKCLSAISQTKGDLTEEELSALKEEKILWGCDACAEGCPLNAKAKITYIKEFLNGYRDKFEINENIRGRAYEWRGKEPIARNYVNLFGKT
ncbi:MAG: DUF1730 domain-containing protein [Clostridia bacterium]|nr:DUF1730 domain-containing protein [Clostridia bacterium]